MNLLLNLLVVEFRSSFIHITRHAYTQRVTRRLR